MSEFDSREYWEQRLRVNAGLDGVGYLALGQGFNRWLYKIRRHVFLRQVRALNLPFPSMNVLDVGSGTGFYVNLWCELGVRNITGSDLTAIAVERLLQRYPACHFVQMDIADSNAQLADATFDAVSIFDVLFHIVDDKKFSQAVRNLSRFVKPNGFLLLSDNFLHGDPVRVKHHVSRSLEEMEAVLQQVGFDVLLRAPMFFLMNAPVDSESHLLRWHWRCLERLVPLHEIVGTLWGAALYPLEILCLSMAREGPSTEMMICRKRG